MNTDERAQILREIDALAKDFESLRLADIDGVLWTQRRMRNAQPQWTDPNVPIQCLLERQNQDVRLVAGMSTYFDESDSPNGWYSTHISAATGGHGKKAFDAIQRAGLWIKRRSVLFAILAKELLSAKGVILGDSAWPDVVQLIAGRGDDATLKIPVWVVQVGVVEFTTDSDGKPYLIPSDKRLPATVTVATWNQRSQIPVVGWLAQITPADEAYIGDPPRMFHCEQKLDSFLRDSELALDWLRRWVDALELSSAHSTGTKKQKGTTNTKTPAKQPSSKKPGRKPIDKVVTTPEEKRIWNLHRNQGKSAAIIALDLSKDQNEIQKVIDRLFQRHKRIKIREKTDTPTES
jgi:hypothetical protein